jgi:hypothetical protein
LNNNCKKRREKKIINQNLKEDEIVASVYDNSEIQFIFSAVVHFWMKLEESLVEVKRKQQ